jgi:hypothetical protein
MADFEELPFTELYLIKADAGWPVYAATSEGSAIALATGEQMKNLGRIRIWRVTAIQVEEMAVQKEIIHRQLVPYGTQVDR